MSNGTSEEKLKEKYAEMKYLEERLGTLHEQMQITEHQAEDLATSLKTLDAFARLQPEDNFLVPLSTGIFAPVKVQKNDSLMVNVGAETIVTKDIAGTRTLLQQQVDEIAELQQKILVQIQKLVQRAKTTEKELQELAKAVSP